MFRLLFLTVLGLHGLIHLMGFAKAFGFTDTRQLQLPVSRAAGFLWLLTCLLFLSSAFLLFLQKDYWWMAALPAVVLSQVLIIANWKDARYGTLINFVVLVPLIVAFAGWNFNRQFCGEATRILNASVVSGKEIIQTEQLNSLPAPVQRWLLRSGITGKETIQTVYIRQKGKMRTKPGARALSFSARQYITTGAPAFAWKARVRMNPLLYIDGRDLFEKGKGRMLVKFLSLYPVADATGASTDQSAALRYLGELAWYPSAALSSRIKWEPVDSLSARATLQLENLSVSGIFHFHPDGDIAGFEAMRYYDRGRQGSTLEKWTAVHEPGAFLDTRGIRIPAKCRVTWKLAEGDFEWLELELAEVVYNKPL